MTRIQVDGNLSKRLTMIKDKVTHTWFSLQTVLVKAFVRKIKSRETLQNKRSKNLSWTIARRKELSED